MEGLMIFPILISLFYLTIIAAVIYLVYTWVTKFISLKEEQNNLLREIIKRLENK
jgi:ABC-type arginine transport system permease subunit